MKSFNRLVLIWFLANHELCWSAPTLQVDVNSGRHYINDNIYGINFAADPAFAAEIRLPFDRWGGNIISRYNWKLNVTNLGGDWFFENSAQSENGALAQTLKDRAMGTKTMLSVSLIGWTARDRERRCGYSVQKYGQQQKVDAQYWPDCGEGLRTDGAKITWNDPTDTSMRIDRSFTQGFVDFIVKQVGRANQGGVQWWELDNEVDIWQGTHSDVHPNPATADELLEATRAHASAIKAVDPSALVLGPVGNLYRFLIYSPSDGANGVNTDRNKYGGLDFGEYYLKAMKEYEDQNHVRILDYLDYHIYPECDCFKTNSQDQACLARRLRCVRGLWDPNYVDESWISRSMPSDKGRLMYIPRMRQMIQKYYPGTKIAISEYSMGQEDTMNGALAQADALGVFAREGVDLACLWGGNNAKLPVAYAIRMFRNFDGQGSRFGDTSVSATSSDQDQLAIYASLRSWDQKYVVIVINKDQWNLMDTTITFNGLNRWTNARVFTYSGADLSRIVQGNPVWVNGNQLSYKFPAYSITLFEI